MEPKFSAHEPATFFYRRDTEIREKVIFGVKRSVHENFQRANFSGPVPTESLCTQDSENIVGLGDRASVIAALSEVIGQKPVVLQKIKGVTKN